MPCHATNLSIAVLTFLQAVNILAQNWIDSVFVTLYLRILHHREKQAGLSTVHNGGLTHHLPATSPEAKRKNDHFNKLSSIDSALFHKTSLSIVLMERCIGGS